MSDVERLALRPDYEISRVIKGGWQLAGDHGSVDRERAIEDMIAFYDAGITTFDCADIYTGVEDMIGAFRSRLANARGAAALERLKIHTKVVPDLDQLAHVDFAMIEAGIDRSLRRLRMERLDMVQTFWWDASVPGEADVIGHLGRLREAGKVRHIGVTNYSLARMRKLAEVGVPFLATLVQYSLIDNRPAGAFAQWCKEHDTAILCYGGLAGGFLTETWLGKPDPGYRFDNRSLVKYRLIIDDFGGWDLFQELLVLLADIAARRDCTLAAVALRATLDLPDAAAVVVGARYAHRLPQTLRCFDPLLDDDDRAALAAVLSRRRGPVGDVYELESDKTGRHGRIMKYNINAKGADTPIG